MMLAIHLPEDVEERLEALAERTGHSKDFFATEAILEHIHDLEAVYLAENRLSAFLSGESSSVPLEDVMKRYGLES